MASPLFSVRYQLQRGDYVSLTTTLTRRPLLRLLFDALLFFAALLVLLMLFLGGPEGLMHGLSIIVGLRAPVWVYLLLLAGPAFSLSFPWLMGLLAAVIYGRTPIADREVTIEFDGAGVQGGTAERFTRIGWGTVLGVIETPQHFFLSISRREALIVPRRAFRTDDEYRTVLGFARARIAASQQA